MNNKIYIVMAKGTEVEHSGKVVFDSKGEWKPHKFRPEKYSEIMAYTTKEDAEWHKEQMESNAQYYGYECEYKVVEATLEI